MAAKILILRPTSVKLPSTGVNGYPEDTPTENLHLLISEEIADNDATYISCHSGIGMAVNFKRPAEYDGILPVSGRLYCNIRAGDMGAGIFITYGEYNEADDNYIEHVLAKQYPDNATDYIMYTPELSSEAIEKIWKKNDHRIEQSKDEEWFILKTYGESPLVKGYIYITQVYLELTYEDTEKLYEPIYIRENNSWTKLTGRIYQKQNGTWQECGTGILLEGSTKVIT